VVFKLNMKGKENEKNALKALRRLREKGQVLSLHVDTAGRNSMEKGLVERHK
jgi:hypothetical protein